MYILNILVESMCLSDRLNVYAYRGVIKKKYFSCFPLIIKSENVDRFGLILTGFFKLQHSTYKFTCHYCIIKPQFYKVLG